MGIQVYPEDDATRFKPMTSFACLDSSLQHYCPNVNAYLKKKAFTKPSAIQAQCWPPLLSGRDVIGIASTGSGKTLTFLIPAILKIFKAGAKPPPSGVPTPRVLVVAPTRELAMQSHQVQATLTHLTLCVGVVKRIKLPLHDRMLVSDGACLVLHGKRP
jgi:superfamily II DNA/RNA helicase